MAHDRHLPLLPAAGFVATWCSGYIVGPWAVQALSPLWTVTLRFVLAALLAYLLARFLSGPLRVSRSDLVRIATTGVLLNGLTFALMYLAFDFGLEATLGALMHSLSPVLTAILGALVFGERLGRVQLVGFVLGVAGVLLVLGPEVGAAGGLAGLLLVVASTFSLSAGTLGQRWIGHAPDRYWSATIQFAAAVPPLIVLAALVEGSPRPTDPGQALLTLVWLAVVNSILGLLLLGILVRARGAGVAASIFFVMPPVTALLAWPLLGETLTWRELLGLALTVLGVAAATRAARPPPGPAISPGPTRSG